MKAKKPLRKGMFLVLLLFLIGLEGCANFRPIVLHPIEDTDIYRMKQGKPYTPKKDGYFVSDYYLREIMRARVRK